LHTLFSVSEKGEIMINYDPAKKPDLPDEAEILAQ